MAQQHPEHVTALTCLVCGKQYAPSEAGYVCPDHGDHGVLDVQYDYQTISRLISREALAASTDFSQWRYRALLPVLPQTAPPPLNVGWTPLVPAPRLAAELGVESLMLKDDSRQPTGSLKDRASALAVMKAREAGAKVITTASTGNAAAALAGMCAADGMKSVIFVPQTAPKAKVAQLVAYGASVYLVRGSYDDAFELCLRAAETFGWYNRNTGYNPYMTEGKKTAAFEICEQLGWKVPDQIFVSVGDGCIIGGLHKGFKDLKALGWIDRLPKLMGVQSEGSDFMWRAADQGKDPLYFPAIQATTVADSISAGLPRDRVKAGAAVAETGGAWVRVPDAAILAAIPRLARGSGVFAEPAAAASLAGLIQARVQGLTTPTDNVVLLVTGNGLKDADAVMRACANNADGPLTIEPELAEVKRTLSKVAPGAAGQ